MRWEGDRVYDCAETGVEGKMNTFSEMLNLWNQKGLKDMQDELSRGH